MRIERIGNATLYLADCREVLPLLTGIDAVVTDPPYGIGHLWKGGSGHGWGKARSEGELRNEWDDVAPDSKLLKQITTMADEVVMWGGNYFDLSPSRAWLVWNKPERGFTLAEAELAWTNRDTVIRVWDGPRSDFGREHPTQKPLNLMKWCIAPLKGRTILDPFMGSGTTGVAALQLGRSFVGIEVHPEYFELACKRIRAAHSQPDLFVAPPAPQVQEALL